ncbi:hypothetical protein MMC06_006139 [Schaereria dolodes]|nr:hypothetical protein [Schaereria dolodes]
MDVVYDHIQEETLSPDEVAEQANKQPSNLNTEFQEAYKSFSASPWGAKLGGFFGNVKKQGESYYQGARQEATAASEEALKGFTDLRSSIVSRARSLSNPDALETPPTTAADNRDVATATHDPDKERTESEALSESEGLISRFRAEATRRFKDVEKAEDAADEALVKFGTNIRNFLRDAVTIAPPTEEKDKDGNSKILFESKDQDGRRVIHTTRFDAQLHVIHSSFASFTKDPVSTEYEKWKSNFSVERKTDEISTDLERYEELRRTMEKLVPEKVEYEEFWKRYYFLRRVIESEEQRRKELLKGISWSISELCVTRPQTNQIPFLHRPGATLSTEEPMSWDSSSSSSEPSTPHPEPRTLTSTTNSSSTTIPQPSTTTNNNNRISLVDTEHPAANNNGDEAPSTNPTHKNITSDSLQPPTTTTSGTSQSSNEPQPRRSQDQHSQPDSDASYDLVSGATSRAPGSPKDEKEKGLGIEGRAKKEGAGTVAEESDEEDWE